LTSDFEINSPFGVLKMGRRQSRPLSNGFKELFTIALGFLCFLPFCDSLFFALALRMYYNCNTDREIVIVQKEKKSSEIGAGGRSRGRRSKRPTRKPVWLYFDEDEHELVHFAAQIEGDSASSFGAKAVLDRAYEVIRRYNRTIAHQESRPISPAREFLDSLKTTSKKR
jgi:uncharacterized protein (DUF1778 family)